MTNLRFSCQQCGKACSDHTKRVPGHVPMGRVLMEQYVCDDCHARCCAALNEHHKDAVTSDPTVCNACGDEGFGAAGPYYAHHRPLVTGDWVTMPVCVDCFGDYHEVCKKNVSEGK